MGSINFGTLNFQINKTVCAYLIDSYIFLVQPVRPYFEVLFTTKITLHVICLLIFELFLLFYRLIRSGVHLEV